jgi:radical SAM protein with 4Fe4S-binding SPASM domain
MFLSDDLSLDYADVKHVRFSDGSIYTFAESPGCDSKTTTADSTNRQFTEAVPQLQLSLTYACNMDCRYCSFRSRIEKNGKPITMPFEIIQKGVTLYCDSILNQQVKYGRIDFGLTGETMLVKHLHEKVHDLAETSITKTSAEIVWSGPNVTNGTIDFDPSCDDTDLGPPQDISLDGPKEVHDRLRSYKKDGTGSYDDVRSLLNIVLRKHSDISVSVVLSSYYTDFAHIFSHLYDEVGVRNIYMKPVNAEYSAEYALNTETLSDFKNGYVALVQHILERSDKEILSRLLALNPEDFFMRFFYRIKDQEILNYRCGAGKSGLYVDTDGKLYPCAHFVGLNGWDIGHVNTGINDELRDHFMSLTVNSREACCNCFAQKVCGGGCYYQAVLINNDIAKPDLVKCELIRYLTLLAIRLFLFLQKEYPAVLAALPSTYGIDPLLIDAPPRYIYRPIGTLKPAKNKSTLNLNQVGKICNGLLSKDDLYFQCSLYDDELTLEFTGKTILKYCDMNDESLIKVWLQPFGDQSFTMGDLRVRNHFNSGKLLRITSTNAEWLVNPEGQYRRIPYNESYWSAADDDVLIKINKDYLCVKIKLNPNLLTAPSLGLNIFASLDSGGEAVLARYEPFVSIQNNCTGPLELVGPDADCNNNYHFWPKALLPLTQWRGLQSNVC